MAAHAHTAQGPASHHERLRLPCPPACLPSSHLPAFQATCLPVACLPAFTCCLSCSSPQDIHSAGTTVREALVFSARLRLTEDIQGPQVGSWVAPASCASQHCGWWAS